MADTLAIVRPLMPCSFHLVYAAPRSFLHRRFSMKLKIIASVICLLFNSFRTIRCQFLNNYVIYSLGTLSILINNELINTIGIVI